jgi:hypothetical protein
MAKEAEVQAPPIHKPALYTFRIKGTDREYDVDRAHLDAMRSRKDAEYVGTIALPLTKK